MAQIWPVPANHRSALREKPKGKKVDLRDLIAGGVLAAGMSLFPRREKYSHRAATLLPDGRVEVDGVAYASPTNAATAITGKHMNGWWFFLTDQSSQRSLRQVRRDYVEAMSVDIDDDEADDGGEDDDA